AMRVERWWEAEAQPSTAIADREWPERLRAALRAAVQRWTLADVPIACSLSGGLDSSSIVGVLAEAGATPATFSLGFVGADEARWNELPQARAVAQHWGTRHQELILDPTSLLDDLVGMVWHLDEPYGGGLPSWSVFKLMARDVKVGLTGTGGDELFGNYGKWRGLERRFLPAVFPREVDAAAFERDFFERFYYFSETEKRSHV